MYTATRTESRTRPREWVLLAAVLLLSALPRLAGSSTQMLSRDEGLSWRMSNYSASDLLRHAPGGNHPPLYYFLLKGWTAVFGISPVAMRSLSVSFSVAALAVLYLLCREFVGQGGALFAVCLAGMSAGQVAVAPVARMYGLGVFLAALTAWLLPRALRAGAWDSPWWSAYGLAVAAFCYTHYFAFFTVLAQTLFVAGDLLARRRAGTWREPLSTAGGFLYAGSLALVIFAPWWSAFRSQAQEVQKGFWIAPLALDDWEQFVFKWLTGMTSDVTTESRIFLVLFAVLLLATVIRGGRGAWIFLLQALIPWLAVLGVFLTTGRTIVQERYLAFAQLGLFGLWSIAWQLAPGRLGRLFLFAFLCPAVAAGLGDHLGRLPGRGPAMHNAAEWLTGQGVDNDLFLIDDYRYVNLFRYYTSRAGLPRLHVKAQAPTLIKGHIAHLGSLTNCDLYWSPEAVWRHAPARVWLVGTHVGWATVQPPERWRATPREFYGGGDSHVTLVLCVPAR